MNVVPYIGLTINIKQKYNISNLYKMGSKYRNGIKGLGDILRNAPKRLELFSPAYGEILFEEVTGSPGMKMTPSIICKSYSGNKKTFFVDGTLSTHGECMLWPSEIHRTWDNWQKVLFKSGNVIVKDEDDEKGPAQTVIYIDGYNFAINDKGQKEEIIPTTYRYADMMEIAVFNATLLRNGFKWNNVTKELERVTEEEMANGKLAANIINMFQKPRFDVSTLKPFDKVLYIPYDTETHGWWRAGIVSYVTTKTEVKTVYLIGMDRPVKQVIPYEGNEDKLGETMKETDFYIK